MVKGVAKHAVIVSSPEPKLFEQAIFIVREEMDEQGISAQEVVAQAQKLADKYLREKSYKRGKVKIPAPVFALAGAAAASAGWIIFAVM